MTAVKQRFPYIKPESELSVKIATAASGSAVLADNKKVAEILKRQRDLTAIDMEAYGVACAAYSVGDKQTDWLIVKGVQDNGTSDKDNPQEKDRFRQYAAYTSASFVKQFITEYLPLT